MSLEELRQKLSPDVQAGTPLAPLTTFRIGGPAEFFFEAKTADDAVRAVSVAAELGLSYYILGGGSNLLIADEGVKGLVVRMANRGVSVEGDRLIAEAGATPGLAAMKAVEAGLGGLEWAAALPGTIGGAIRGNAGCFGGEMKDCVETVRVLADGRDAVMSNADCQFGYRDSAFKHRTGLVILSAVLKLKPGADKAAGQALMQKIVLEKKDKQPVESFTAGCMFTNWKPNNPDDVDILRRSLDLNKEEVIPVTPQGTVPAGWIIDRAQLKGMKMGHISISPKHGNFFVNDGQGTASEVIALAAAVKMKVRDMTHGVVQFLEEVEYVGF